MKKFHEIVQQAHDYVDTLVIHGAKLTADERKTHMYNYVNERLEEHLTN